MSRPKLSMHSIQVLLVDDQAFIGEAVARMLSSEADIRFHHCPDPTKALALVTELQPTVILQDLVMPGVDGLTLVRYFRAHPASKEIPVIVLSTKEDAKVKADAFAVGANDYLVKLPERIELLARIRYHSRGYINLLERNEAYDALVESQKQLEIRNRFIRETFGRYLSEEIVASLLETPEGQNLGGEKRRLTIMMTDLRGFTPLAERLTPEQMLSLINNYLEVMTDIIVEYGGTIDEFIGDAILVIFGAPTARPDDAKRAVACAVAMQLAIPIVNEKNRRLGLPDVEMGIGLNTGEVVIGNIGSKKRAKYGIVGSHVNLTARIESFTVGGQILASEATVQEAGQSVRVDGVFRVEPKGVKEPINIYDVGGIGPPYNVSLASSVAISMTLESPIPIRYTVIESKDSGGPQLSGAITALSEVGGQVQTEIPLPPQANLKMCIALSETEADSLVFYGKTPAAPRSGAAQREVFIRFTSMPDAVKRFFHNVRKSRR